MDVGNREWKWKERIGFSNENICNTSGCTRLCCLVHSGGNVRCNETTRPLESAFCEICRPCCETLFIEQQPSKVLEGETARFSITVSGTSTPEFQWQHRGTRQSAPAFSGTHHSSCSDSTTCQGDSCECECHWRNTTNSTATTNTTTGTNTRAITVKNITMSLDGRRTRVRYRRSSNDSWDISNESLFSVTARNAGNSNPSVKHEADATPKLPAWRLCSCGTLRVQQTLGSNRIVGLENGQSPWLAWQNDIKRINLTGDIVAGNSITGLFHGLSKLEGIDNITRLKTADVTDIRNLFSGCESLTKLDISGWDLRKVNQMSNMFEGTTSLSSLKLPATPESSTAVITSSVRFRFTCDVALPAVPINAQYTGVWVNGTDESTSEGLTQIHQSPPPSVAPSHLRFVLSDDNGRQNIELLRPAESEIRTEISEILDNLISETLPLPSASSAANNIIQEFAKRLNDNTEIRGRGSTGQGWTAVTVSGTFNRREMRVQSNQLGLDESTTRLFTLTASLPDEP